MAESSSVASRMTTKALKVEVKVRSSWTKASLSLLVHWPLPSAVGRPSVTIVSMMRLPPETSCCRRPHSCRSLEVRGVTPRGPLSRRTPARRATCLGASPAPGSTATKSRPSCGSWGHGGFSSKNSLRTPARAFHSACAKAMAQISSQRVDGAALNCPPRLRSRTWPSELLVEPELSRRNTRNARPGSSCASMLDKPQGVSMAR
mmetsp:Transcript_64905/g.201059  ORF Transcript_64905/g.201059 Transcript_64905/m.201059 type:complete len:204 (+) Transcript_64905:563-1174(+)